jgi:hypothetical protein
VSQSGCLRVRSFIQSSLLARFAAMRNEQRIVVVDQVRWFAWCVHLLFAEQSFDWIWEVPKDRTCVLSGIPTKCGSGSAVKRPALCILH